MSKTHTAATERWTVTLSSGKTIVFDEWKPLSKFLFDDEVDMADYPVSVSLVLMEDGKERWPCGGPVEVAAFQAIYSHGLEDAAPELWAALRAIVSLDDDAHPGLSTWVEARQKAYQDARAAIKKATTK